MRHSAIFFLAKIESLIKETAMLGRLQHQTLRITRSRGALWRNQFKTALSGNETCRGFSASGSTLSITHHRPSVPTTTAHYRRRRALSTEQQSSSSSSTTSQTHSVSKELELRDERLKCSQHLDPTGEILPTSEWIHVNGTLPICSMDEVIQSFERILRREEAESGIVDLDALWNPLQDSKVPSLSLEDNLVQAAHVVVSPFGRPNGWLLKFANRSLTNVILEKAQRDHIHVVWKVVQVREHHYCPKEELENDPAHHNGLLVDDSMVRFENCPFALTEEELRLRLSRYDLAPTGNTIIKWGGKTDDGKRAPLMFVVRFASPAWARAAIREMQSLALHGKIIKLVQYPQQMRYYTGEDGNNGSDNDDADHWDESSAV
eukprot:scaffold858_cov123-Cylindrotheca_fusiformis.AAC.8